MRTLELSELQSVHGAGNYSDLEVLGITSASASLYGALGYAFSYQTFAITEGIITVAAITIPTAIATSMVLGGIQAYHYFTAK